MSWHTLPPGAGPFMQARKAGQRPTVLQHGLFLLHAEPAFPQPVGSGEGTGGWQKWHCAGSTAGPQTEPGGGRAPDMQRTWVSQIVPLQHSPALELEAPHIPLGCVQLGGGVSAVEEGTATAASSSNTSMPPTRR
jgi:hypothetical protein